MSNVVVTGLGALTPIGNNVATYWQNLLQGQSGAAPITHFDATRYKTQFACELKQYCPEDHFEYKEIRRLDLYTQYALVAAEEALQDAALNLAQEDRAKVGVVWGTGIGGMQTVVESTLSFERSGEALRMHPFFLPKSISNMAGGLISIKYGLQGPNFTTVSACAGANNALISAAQLIQLGHADVVITGGSEAVIAPVVVSGFNAIRALSTRNHDPKTASRPFDQDRDGFVLGEGAGALVLESYEHAKARNAKIYAELLGVGMSADAHHITAPQPEGTGAAQAMNNALHNAGIEPQAVDYINVHGTATVLGDISEAKAIQHVFGPHAYRLNISATKSMTGHLLGASGAIESIATILALQNQTVPPTINHFTQDPAFDPKLNFTFNQAQQRTVDIALTNALGFGGHNTTILYKRWAA